ncbi:MAG: GW dipeptide domain-containing protein, partial [Candidatus Fimimonas sp.]
VEIFAHDGNDWETTNQKIGTDVISLNVAEPKNFSGFTLAKPTGYPTNIVYRTEFESSVSEIKTEYYDEFIILDFDGSDDLDYYYVLVGDKFGWVAKSGKNVTAQTDDKIEIINNKVSSEVQFNAKFTSANAVHVYELPRTNSNYTTFTQSLDDPQDAVVLQKFVETLADGTTAEWYYVAYGEGQRGFVLTKNVGKFYTSGSIDTDGTPVLGYKKINASLFEAVKLFATSELVSTETVHNDAGEIKLYSGTMVVVVREEKGASFVEIRQNDGSTTYGWVKSANLIGTHDITTNAIVGITILSVAVVLSLVLVGVFTTRKKRRRVVDDSAE